MLINTNTKDSKGNKVYYDTDLKARVILPTGSPCKIGRIPNGVYGRFIRPQYQ